MHLKAVRCHRSEAWDSSLAVGPASVLELPWGLTQSADGTVVGLVAQSVSAGVTETQVSAGQDERVSEVRQTNDTLVAVVTVLILRWLRGRNEQSEKYVPP